MIDKYYLCEFVCVCICSFAHAWREKFQFVIERKMDRLCLFSCVFILWFNSTENKYIFFAYGNISIWTPYSFFDHIRSIAFMGSTNGGNQTCFILFYIKSCWNKIRFNIGTIVVTHYFINWNILYHKQFVFPAAFDRLINFILLKLAKAKMFLKKGGKLAQGLQN